MPGRSRRGSGRSRRAISRRVRRIAIDEFALHKGQTYATLVVDVDDEARRSGSRAGATADALDGFFAALGPAGCARIEAVVLDLAIPFVKAVQRALSAGRDRLRSLSRAAALHGASARSGAIRRSESASRGRIGTSSARAPGAPATAPHRQRRFGGSCSARGANLRRPAERVRLKELLAANRALLIVYVLKEDLRALWRYRSPRRRAARVGALVRAGL